MPAGPTGITSGTGANRHVRMAERLCENGDTAGALVSLNKALEQGADACECYIRIAGVHMMVGRLEDAVAAAQQAVGLGPRRLAARETLAIMLTASMDYAAVVEQCRAMLRISPRNLTARDLMMQAQMALGRQSDALGVATDMIRLDPVSALLRLKRAVIYLEMRQTAQAFADLEMVATQADEPDLQAVAESYMHTLDDFHLECIEALAADDALFRAQLGQDPENAADSRHMPLSPVGKSRLRHFCDNHLSSLPLPDPMRSYN
ncbi:MAG: hypothetical protein NT029_10445 [Armatimonadetes bacterium]|nr:hypothetical protein [Armatimonadota bacterium]